MSNPVRMEHLLPGGEPVRFAEANAALARNQGAGDAALPHGALRATVVVVGPTDSLPQAGEALRELSERVGLRAILIALGTERSPAVEVSGCAIAIGGLKPQYVNNAVAALRLSSLPTAVWWRGGDPGMLEGLAALSDRIVLDEASAPEAGWKRAIALFSHAAFGDLRWARLTRWRALLANFFDAAEVRETAGSFDSVRICGADGPTARLLAGWLQTSLEGVARLSVDVTTEPGEAPIREVSLGGPSQELTLRLAGGGSCVKAAARVAGARAISRVVTLGDQRAATLLSEELQVRARDPAFERALRAIV